MSRNNQYITFKKEDLAVGLETSVTALIILITHSVNELMKLKYANFSKDYPLAYQDLQKELVKAGKKYSTHHNARRP